MTDWARWHAEYEDDGSPLSRRLQVVRAHLHDWLDATAPRPVRVLSLCAGDGRDLLDVLASRADRSRVGAVLVELSPDLAAQARARATSAGLTADVREGDAARPELYVDAVPADLVLLAGVFGNISDDDVRGTIQALPLLCAPHARVVWTRHRNEPDLTPAIRTWVRRGGLPGAIVHRPSGRPLHRRRGRLGARARALASAGAPVHLLPVSASSVSPLGPHVATPHRGPVDRIRISTDARERLLRKHSLQELSVEQGRPD